MGKHATALLLTATALAATAASVPASASAQVPSPGGVPAAGTPAVGGLPAGPPPVISGISCRATCAGLQRAAAGSVVRLTGRGLSGVASVVFLGGRGRRDDVGAAVAGAPADDALEVAVPAGARSGRLRAIAAGGAISRASSQRVEIGGARGAPVVEAHVDSKRVFLDGRSRPSLSLFVGGDAPSQVRVDLVRDGDVAPVASWTPEPQPAGSVQTIAWDGAVAPVAPPEGRYEFRVTPVAGPALAIARSAPRAAQSAGAAAVTSGFLLLGHAFPVQGAHTIGLEPSQRFGALRSGHAHRGQDVFAACGTPLVAAAAGVVRYRATQAAAGNYVVLRTDADQVDLAYMHLRDRALAARGTHVAPGQLLGYVGDTGDADGCHLHLEKWPSPGWYSGGAPVDPLADLQSWDRTS